MDKNKIIYDYTKKEFMEFLENDTTGKILELLDNEGLVLLKSSPLKQERINYILNHSKYRNKLLENNVFLDMMLNDEINCYGWDLGNLDYQEYELILKRCLNLNKSTFFLAKIFASFNVNYKLKKLDNWPYTIEMLYELIKYNDVEVIKKILMNYNLDLTTHNIDLQDFFQKMKNSSLIKVDETDDNTILPSRIITKKVAQKIWNNYNIYTIRSIINDAMYSVDISVLNDYLKEQEEKEINNEKLVFPISEIYESFLNYHYNRRKFIKGKLEDVDDYEKTKSVYQEVLKKLANKKIYFKKSRIFLDDDIDYFQQLNDNYLSNYIIDYHFEENYYNVLLDLKELLNFYYNKNIYIPEERINLYEKVINIDSLSYEEKIALHNEMKKINITEVFYDDMLYARKIVAQSIKDNSISSQTIKQYRDKKLSNKYGVDIYKIDGNPFFGIVKSGNHTIDDLPTGHSYSLIGDNCLATYDDPKHSQTFLYDSQDVDIDQIVHVFPFDSYTLYHPFESTKNPTNKVNKLLTARELLTQNKNYNEILVLEKGQIQTSIDRKIPILQKIALYCLDEITNKDIESAKKNNVGIILINSNKYLKSDYKDKTLEDGLYMDDIYFDDSEDYDIKEFERKRQK